MFSLDKFFSLWEIDTDPPKLTLKYAQAPNMTLTKSNVIDAIAEQNGFSKQNSSKTFEILLEIIKRSLESGEDVLISSFGKFNVKAKKQRRGRNPATGQPMLLAARKVVTFSCSGRLRDKINGA